MNGDRPTQYLSLGLIGNLNDECRYFYVNLKDRTISIQEKIDDEFSQLWTPLFLASDVLSINSVGKCNKSRVHAGFGKQGLATKVVLPKGVKFSRLPAGNVCGVWFYSVYGVIQAVMQNVKGQHQKIEFLDALMDIWKLRVHDPLLPEVLDNLSITHRSNPVPMPVDLIEIASSRASNSSVSNLCSEQCVGAKLSYISSTGCVVRAKHFKKDVREPQLLEKASDVPAMALEVSVSSEPCRMISAGCSQRCVFTKDSTGRKREMYPAQRHISPSKASSSFDGKRDSDASSRELSKEGVVGGLKNIPKCLNCAKATKGFRHWSSGKGPTSPSEQYSSKEDILVRKLCKRIYSLEVTEEEDSLSWLNRLVDLILDEILELETELLEQRSDLPCRHLWNSSSLVKISHWLGEKFNLLVPEVMKNVDNFKKANVDQITELPSDRELITELFPPAMCAVFLTWIGLEVCEIDHEVRTRGQRPDENAQTHVSSKQMNKGTYSLLLLLLEFSNQALVSGVAHVLYPRFVAS